MRSFPKSAPRENHTEKNLIADQPGRLVLFGGVILAVILGFSIRGVTSPGKVKTMVEQAASRIHKDVNVTFQSAELSLHRGLLPRLAVIITNVKMESANECWMKPQLTADEFRLPLSFWALIQGQNPVTQVEAGKVEISLRSEYKNCEDQRIEPVQEEPRIKQFVTLKSSVASEKTTEAPPQVEAILIDQFKISAPGLDEPLELSSFATRLKSNSPRVVELTAKTHLMRDSQVAGDYLSHATLWAQYTEFPKRSVQARVSGNWREGSYQLTGNYLLKEEELTSELDLKHIPLNQVFQIFRKIHWLNDDLNARQVWVSLNAQLHATKANLNRSDMHIKDLRLEGDLGDLTTPEVRITSLDPLRYDPFQVDIQRLSIEKLLALTNRPHPSAALGQLGTFSGTASVQDKDHIQVEGVHRGLEFIFANKGQRELQTLKELAGKMTLQANAWTLGISRFVPDQGVFDGDLQLTSDRNFKNIEIKARAKELKLSPNVVRLMTAGGHIGAFSGDLVLKLQEGKMSTVKGTFNSEDIDVEGVRMEKAKMNFDSLKGEIVSQAQVQKLTIKVGSPAFQILRDMVDADWMSDNQLVMKTLSGQFRSKDLKSVAWRNFQSQGDKGARVTSEGEWDDQGFLSGQVFTRSGKNNHRWMIQGKRDLPVFSLVTETPQKRTK